MIYTDSAKNQSLPCVLQSSPDEEEAGRGAAAARREKTATPVDKAYNEFCRLEAQGEAPERDEFLARYPAIQSSLALVLLLHTHTREHPHFYDPPEVRWPRSGEDFLGFHLERELGCGAFSHVFLATEPALGGRRVVVKVSRLGAAEALTLGRLEHPNIGPVYSVRLEDLSGLAAVCMPYLGDATFEDLLEQIRSASAMPRRATVILDVARKASLGEQPLHTEAAAASQEFFSR